MRIVAVVSHYPCSSRLSVILDRCSAVRHAYRLVAQRLDGALGQRRANGRALNTHLNIA